jgi:hypothetical protein
MITRGTWSAWARNWNKSNKGRKENFSKEAIRKEKSGKALTEEVGRR